MATTSGFLAQDISTIQKVLLPGEKILAYSYGALHGDNILRGKGFLALTPTRIILIRSLFNFSLYLFHEFVEQFTWNPEKNRVELLTGGRRIIFIPSAKAPRQAGLELQKQFQSLPRPTEEMEKLNLRRFKQAEQYITCGWETSAIQLLKQIDSYSDLLPAEKVQQTRETAAQNRKSFTVVGQIAVLFSLPVYILAIGSILAGNPFAWLQFLGIPIDIILFKLNRETHNGLKFILLIIRLIWIYGVLRISAAINIPKAYGIGFMILLLVSLFILWIVPKKYARRVEKIFSYLLPGSFILLAGWMIVLALISILPQLF